MRSKHPTVSCPSEGRHFFVVIAKESTKTRGRVAKLPLRSFEKPACEKQYG